MLQFFSGCPESGDAEYLRLFALAAMSANSCLTLTLREGLLLRYHSE